MTGGGFIWRPGCGVFERIPGRASALSSEGCGLNRTYKGNWMRVSEALSSEVRPLSDCIWEIPPTAKQGMLVPARIYASEALVAQMDAGVFEQVTNVACLPGIVRASLCMPDGH